MKIKEHFDTEKMGDKKLEVRLICSQAISAHDTNTKELKCMALSKICQTLRDIGAHINRIHVTACYVDEVSQLCKLCFNLFSLFFEESCKKGE